MLRYAPERQKLEMKNLIYICFAIWYNNLSKIGNNCLNYYTIQSFKGLESKIVFLVDVKGFGDDENRFLNYVAMSRARILLYIFYDVSCEEDYYETLDKGRELL